jgi:hypothetical protein
MIFNNLEDLFQYFVNEYIKPGDKVLILNYYNEKIKKMINFIDSEPFFVCNTYLPGIDIKSDYYDLPFEQNSFNIIINFTDNYNLFEYLKKDGVIIINDEILNEFNYYYLNNLNNNEIFTILRS